MERRGECRGCGQHCCSTVIVPVTPEGARRLRGGQGGWTVLNALGADDLLWLGYHGLGPVVRIPRDTPLRDGPDGDTFAVLPLPCRQLTPDGGCAVFGTAARPALCGDWPAAPRDLALLSPEGRAACGYWFRS